MKHLFHFLSSCYKETQVTVDNQVILLSEVIANFDLCYNILVIKCLGQKHCGKGSIDI